MPKAISWNVARGVARQFRHDRSLPVFAELARRLVSQSREVMRHQDDEPQIQAAVTRVRHLAQIAQQLGREIFGHLPGYIGSPEFTVTILRLLSTSEETLAAQDDENRFRTLARLHLQAIYRQVYADCQGDDQAFLDLLEKTNKEPLV